MKQQIFIIFIFTFILHTGAKLKQDDVLLPEKSQKKFQYDMLNTHNLLRKHHGTMKLLIIILINQIFQLVQIIVWKDTKKLGIGIALAKEGRKIYVVAQYSPPGNYRQAYNTNVFPAKC